MLRYVRVLLRALLENKGFLQKISLYFLILPFASLDINKTENADKKVVN
jgi:hypothetical protein